MDKYESEKKEAGYEKLAPFSDILDIIDLCKYLNISYVKALYVDCETADMVLLYNYQESVCNKKFSEIVNRKK